MTRATDAGEISSPPQLQAKNARDRGRHHTGVRQRNQINKPTIAVKGRNRLRATSSASVVFPIPPGPVSVIARQPESKS